MWTLLSAAAQRTHNGANEPLPVRSGSANGSHGVSALVHDGSRQVRVFMHPGRLELGVVDLARADAQFDLRTARTFGSLEEAEPACAGRSGFLLELSRTGSRLDRRAPASVFFVERLRR